jgi:hypothetical protein
MAYPFLPVNSCCTDVVLNSPCGCSSTLPNSGCGQDPCGTNVIIASNVLYNGPALDCIIVEPCDTLNVILQKIDEIICNLLIQINTLNIQISNITGQIININSEIIDINNTLDVCCNATTTTTTTAIPCSCSTYTLIGPFLNPGNVTYVPCGETEVVTTTAPDVLIEICIDAAYPIIEIGDVNLINTSVCCEVTTTTTTTSLPCNCYQVFANDGDHVTVTTCDGLTVEEIFEGTPSTIPPLIGPNSKLYCAQIVTVLEEYFIRDFGLCEPEGYCDSLITTTTTTTASPTTTTTTTVICGNFSLTGLSGGGDWTGIDCYTGTPVGANIGSGATEETGCIVSSSLNYTNLEEKGTIECLTTTTTTRTPTTTTTSTTVLGYAQSFGAEFEDSATACLETVETYTIYTNTPTVSFSSTFYNEIGLTTLFNGGGLWYKEISGTSAWQIGASGNPLGSALC